MKNNEPTNSVPQPRTKFVGIPCTEPLLQPRIFQIADNYNKAILELYSIS